MAYVFLFFSFVAGCVSFSFSSLCLTFALLSQKNVPEMSFVMSQEPFQKVIVKLAKGKTLKGKALVLLVCKVQEWSYLFQDCRGFQDTYINLQKQGLEFPPPTRELMEEQSRINARRIDIEVERKRLADPLRKLKDSVVLLQGNLRLVIEMLAAVDPMVEDVRASELIPPLLESIGKQRPRITELISSTQDEELMGMLLVVNDDINNTFEWYQQLLAGVRPEIPIARASRKDQVKEQPKEQPRAVQLQPPQSPPPALLAPHPTQTDDPFAVLARSRKARSSGVQQPPVQSPPSSPLDLLFSSSTSPSIPPPVLTPVVTQVSPYPFAGGASSGNISSNPSPSPFDVFLLANNNAAPPSSTPQSGGTGSNIFF